MMRLWSSSSQRGKFIQQNKFLYALSQSGFSKNLTTMSPSSPVSVMPRSSSSSSVSTSLRKSTMALWLRATQSSLARTVWFENSSCGGPARRRVSARARARSSARGCVVRGLTWNLGTQARYCTTEEQKGIFSSKSSMSSHTPESVPWMWQPAAGAASSEATVAATARAPSHLGRPARRPPRRALHRRAAAAPLSAAGARPIGRSSASPTPHLQPPSITHRSIARRAAGTAALAGPSAFGLERHSPLPLPRGPSAPHATRAPQLPRVHNPRRHRRHNSSGERPTRRGGGHRGASTMLSLSHSKSHRGDTEAPPPHKSTPRARRQAPRSLQVPTIQVNPQLEPPETRVRMAAEGGGGGAAAAAATTSKKVLNAPEAAVHEMLEGVAYEAPNVTRLDGFDRGVQVLLRTDWSAAASGKVALVSGGGSGHEPAHGGYIGAGMLTAGASAAPRRRPLTRPRAHARPRPPRAQWPPATCTRRRRCWRC